MMIGKEKMFSDTGIWYKGNLHSHTTNSDGLFTPAEAVLAYKKNGYSFLCLSEHDYYTDLRSEFDSKDFIILPGLEASAYLIDSSSIKDVINLESDCKTGGNKNHSFVDITSSMLLELRKQGIRPRVLKTHHIHGILGTKEMQKAAGDAVFNGNEKFPSQVYVDCWDGRMAAQSLSDKLKSRGCFTTYNHPIWSRVDVEEVRDLNGIWAIECYNYNTVNECGEGSDTVFWDAMLRGHNMIHGFASDDNHNEGIFPDSFGGYVVVKSEKLDHDSIVSNLLNGNYYSSNGAVISQWGIKDNKVYVCCENAERINFICGGYVGASYTLMTKNSELLNFGEYSLRGGESYVRIEVIDKNGKKAWTNPMVL